MTQTYNNTNLRKGKHLSYSERCQIAILKKRKLLQPSDRQSRRACSTNNK